MAVSDAATGRPQRRAPFSKVFCVGLDGATFDVIDPMIQQGRLPTLGKLLAQGVRGELASTVPPLSAPAWVTFMTGSNPGRHGIFHFRTMNEGKLGEGLVGTWMFRGRTIFDLASRAGLKVLAFRVPITYPPWPVNGAMISGFPTPDPRNTYSEPRTVGERMGPLLKLSPMRSMMSDVDAQIENFDYYIERSTKAIVDLIDTDVNLFCYVNSITDWVAHKFWRHSDPGAPDYEAHTVRGTSPLHYFYERTDDSLGTILDKAPHDALLIVISDHGTGPRSTKRFNTNAWLESTGFLSRAGGHRARTFASGALEWAKEKAPKKYWLWQHSPKLVRRGAGALRSYGGAIEWGASRAFTVKLDHHVEGVNVNLAGREPHGCVPRSDYESVRDEILEAARAATDPASGAPVFEGAVRREDLYSGPSAGFAPDVVLILNRDFEFGIAAERQIFTETLPSRLGRSSATHRPEGILAMAGPGVKQGLEVEGASLIDIPATIMWALGLEVPREMDGRVLAEAFDEDLMTANPVRRSATELEDTETGAYTEEEEKQMATHLEDLGYL